MRVIPPMDDEPPPEYVDFVAAHERDLHREATRLVGGDPVGDELYMESLTDVAAHWRRLCWWGRLRGADVAAAYLRRRLGAHARHWRDDQFHEVDVRVLPAAPVQVGGPAVSVALRKAAVLPGTARTGLTAIADAGISWVQAYRRCQWRLVGWRAVGVVLLLGGLVQCLNWVAGPRT